MIRRLVAVAVIGAMPVALAGQQPAAQAPSSDIQLEKIKNDVRTFEIVLFRTVETAGQKVAAWAQQVVPQTILSLAADPVVNGFSLPDASLVFMVRIPELAGVTVFNTGRRFFESTPGAGASGTGAATSPARSVADSKVTSTAVVADDPMKVDPPTPNSMYSDFVRLGLMDAMLDSSSVLTLKEGQWLTVAVVPVDVLVTNPLYRNPSRKLVLSIKTDDLVAFRAGKLTREEVKLKIVDTRF